MTRFWNLLVPRRALHWGALTEPWDLIANFPWHPAGPTEGQQ